MDTKDKFPKADQYVTQTPEDDQTFPDRPPPAYSESPPIEICLFRDWLADIPVVLKMKGHYASPDFEIIGPSDGQILGTVGDMCQIYHEMTIQNGVDKSNYFTIKRKTVEGGLWRYTAHRPGQKGQKILEFDDRPKQDPSKRQRLIFRDAMSNELDAIDMQLKPGSDGELEITYHGKRIGSIVVKSSFNTPEYKLSIEIPGVDPILFVTLAWFIDARNMSDRRRLRRGGVQELKSVGKGLSTLQFWYLPLVGL